MKLPNDYAPGSCKACVEADRAGITELKGDGYLLGTFQRPYEGIGSCRAPGIHQLTKKLEID